MSFIPKGYISGLELSASGNTISINSGECSSIGGLLLLLISDSKSLSDALFSGTVSADTWYHAFVIHKSDDDSVSWGFDTSPNADNIPVGYSDYQWIGAIKTDGDGTVIPFVQNGNEFLWKKPVSSFNTTNPSTTAVLQQVDVPTGVTVKAHISANVLVIGGSTLNTVMLVTSPFQDDVAPSSSVLTVRAYGQTKVQSDTASVTVLTDASARIRYRVSDSDSTLRVRGTTFGWTAPRAGSFGESAGSASSVESGVQDIKGEWTPKLTLVNEGDLSVTYDRRLGDYVRIGRLVFITFYIRTDGSAPNNGWSYSTASGALVIEGIPFDAIAGTRHTGGLSWGGINFNSGHKTAVLNMNDSGTRLTIDRCGDNIDLGNVEHDEVPSGTMINLRGSITYIAKE